MARCWAARRAPPPAPKIIWASRPGYQARARAVVVASGARYKRPIVANLKPFEGDNVHYWASPVEAKLCAGEEIALVGAGNSAGQAVVFLAPQVKHLTMIVRGNGLEASMSRYLIDRIKMLENVDVLVQSELVELHGDQAGALEGATVRDRASGATSHLPARHLFMFIGAEPNTAWLNGCLALDDKGYILTGPQSATGAQVLAPLLLQTTLPRVFAIGDVRSGSTKRVASAVGEGAAVVAQIHSILGASAMMA
jgi:thioredoxin reductase (NADPH)